MTTRPLQIGDIVTASFPEQKPQGREQEGYRPAISSKTELIVYFYMKF